MPNRTYRLTRMHLKVDHAIRDELGSTTPNRMRLLRLRMAKAFLRGRLNSLLRTGPAAA